MKLYHGTTEKNAESIMKSGKIKPRGLRKVASNWKETVESNEKTVYLTDIYGAYFAAAVTKPPERWAIIEIESDELDKRLMVPDEDYLEQATRDNAELNIGGTMKERTEVFRSNISKFKYLWRDSIENMGTCGYMGEVSLKVFTKVVMYKPVSNKVITYAAIDPTITIMNHRYCGNRYRALTRWFMGGNMSLEEFYDMSWPFLKEKLSDEEINEFTKKLNNKSGLEVVYERKENDGKDS